MSDPALPPPQTVLPSTPWPITPPPPSRRRVRPATVVVIIVAGLVVLGAAVVGVGFAVHHGPSDTQQAIRACEKSVEGQLKAPATAQFSQETTDSNGPGYHVEGAVDAQNSFGALVRSRWTCESKRTNDGTWIGTASIEDNG